MRFSVGAKGLAALRDIELSQSPALRFAEAHLDVTGNLDDFGGSNNLVHANYDIWAGEEGLHGRERRNRDDFKHDLLAALGPRGVIYDQRRWHDPNKPRSGKGKRVRGWFGFKLKP